MIYGIHLIYGSDIRIYSVIILRQLCIKDRQSGQEDRWKNIKSCQNIGSPDLWKYSVKSTRWYVLLMSLKCLSYIVHRDSF